MPYYLEYVFNDGVKTDFHDIAEFFFDDVFERLFYNFQTVAIMLILFWYRFYCD